MAKVKSRSGFDTEGNGCEDWGCTSEVNGAKSGSGGIMKPAVAKMDQDMGEYATSKGSDGPNASVDKAFWSKAGQQGGEGGYMSQVSGAKKGSGK